MGILCFDILDLKLLPLLVNLQLCFSCLIWSVQFWKILINGPLFKRLIISSSLIVDHIIIMVLNCHQMLVSAFLVCFADRLVDNECFGGFFKHFFYLDAHRN